MAHAKLIEEFNLLSRGNKYTSLDDRDETEDTNRSEGLMDNLSELLHFERIAYTNNINHGIYEQDKNRVRLESLSGKRTVGYCEDSVNYLKPHEALLMIEMSKLAVFYDSVIVSVEQAYALFLDEPNEVSMEEYLVYSYLNRAGYNIFLHDPETDKQKYEATKKRRQLKNEDEMIIFVLKKKLNRTEQMDLVESQLELYQQTKKTMELCCEKISGKRHCDEPDAETQPNIQSEEPASKRHKLDHTVSQGQDSSFLDVLKAEPEFATYREIFNRFSFIKRAENFGATSSNLSFKFDVFLPKPNFKKSSDLPNYRLLIIK